MIDSKLFMEFFEKEFDVKFVDIVTGKNALDMISQKQICENCIYIIRGDGKTLLKEDMVCGNPDSDCVTYFMSNDDSCMQWEPEKK